ncbi:hypothetical protein HRR80_008920 [Exophiala dermatitidis]|uniref:Uncharacterized protein n=1 Tax=Exophiala dermatitidis TaxID=5970 RepID=A0AAN6ENJ9_EXODE|nr:hypothetical protein HRR77_008939 [Exophiala dermatitidis]KAJ4539997.1 hypothetical protein HRR76_003419 [Exophiala dermatitidis]KAJ4554942.1 hypothetical protein HRR79_009222 [Exophiala dermatitidis]KAJ4577619.1 hypothetical protein HRR82_005486 [Exophiala dermatitidis]KAJ4608895.1 hypothetical protein HRR85_007228 [Exophiala dermatitidis]
MANKVRRRAQQMKPCHEARFDAQLRPHLQLATTATVQRLIPIPASHQFPSSCCLSRCPRSCVPSGCRFLPILACHASRSLGRKLQTRHCRRNPVRPRMDSRADTLSGRFGEQWEFLSHPPRNTTSQARSLPPSSSYLRSDRSNVSPLPTALHFQHLNASRSSLARNGQTSSIGGNSSTTIPSQPVVVRVHSADASIQIHPTSRPQRPKGKMSKDNQLPPIQEYSIQGILAAVDEEIEDSVNAISEILGRSRLVLADQHDSHLPPQGEIRATGNSLQAVAEASSSNERLAAADDVLILREDASLVEGSHAGSAAYGLLERLQTVPRNRRMRSDVPTETVARPASSTVRNYSAPAVLAEEPPVAGEHNGTSHPESLHGPRQLLRDQPADHEAGEAPSRVTNAVVSETYLSAGANAATVSDPPVVSEGGRHYVLYSYDHNNIFETPISSAPACRTSFLRRLQSLIPSGELHALTTWVHGRSSPVVTAESQLRDILARQQRRDLLQGEMQPGHEDAEMYS